jgi:hypothetical protein
MGHPKPKQRNLQQAKEERRGDYHEETYHFFRRFRHVLRRSRPGRGSGRHGPTDGEETGPREADPGGVGLFAEKAPSQMLHQRALRGENAGNALQGDGEQTDIGQGHPGH